VQEPSDFITLIEARPFPAQLRQIAGSFRIEKFPTIFRNCDLVSVKSPPVMQNHNFTDASVDDVPSAYWNPSTKASTYAAFAPVTQSQVPPVPPSTSNLNLPGNGKVLHIFFNQSGHRLDPVVRYDKRLYPSLRERKLCNAFFLTKCEFRNCSYDHRSTLSQEELSTLRYFAKLNACQSASCRDPCCISGHVCPYDGKCNYGKNCRFPAGMHNVNKEIDNRLTLAVAI